MEREIDDATLGFATIMVMTPNDAERGPTMLKQTINRRTPSKASMKKFVRGVKEHGLHNRSQQNAITIGVKREHVKLDSLRPLKLGQYTNKVQWTTKAEGEERTMVLYNGSHRIEYMACHSSCLETYDQYVELDERIQATTEKCIRDELTELLEKMFEELDENGVWVAKFLDIGERQNENKRTRAYFYSFAFGTASEMIRKSEHRALIEHNLTSNKSLVLKLDTEDDGLTQVLSIINGIPVDEREAFAKQLVARIGTKKKSKLGRILVDKEACLAAVRFNHLTELRASTKGGGMSVRHLTSWSPAIGGVSIDGDLIFQR